MKKYILCVLVYLLFSINVYAGERIEVKLAKCVDGDTAVFIVNNEEIKFRFLAIDTPETVHPTKGEEEGGKVASNYTCEQMKKAKKIEILYDEKSKKTDKYGRGLAWIYADDKLLQEDLISKGYAEVAYVYGKYEFIDHLCEVQRKAKEEKLGIWAGNRKEGYCQTKTNSKTTSTMTKEKSTQKPKKEEDLELFLEDKIKETTYIPALVILCLALITVKVIKKKKKRK